MSAVHADAKLVELFSNVARLPPASCRRRRKEHARRAAAVGCALLCLALFRGSGLVSRPPRAEGLVGRVSRSVTDPGPKAEARQKKAVGLDSMAEKNIETDESHHYRDTISHDLTYSALMQLPIMRLRATLSERATLAGSLPRVRFQ